MSTDWFKRAMLTTAAAMSFLALAIPAWLHEPMHIAMSKALGGNVKEVIYLDEKARNSDRWSKYRPIPDFFLSKVPVSVKSENGPARGILVSLAPLLFLPVGLNSLLSVDSVSPLHLFSAIFLTAAGFPSKPDLVGAKKGFDVSVDRYGVEEVLFWN